MKKSFLLLSVTLFFAPAVYAEDAEQAESTESEEISSAEELPSVEPGPAVEPGGPKKMSGMSILGNEETPKSLVIVPWKSSEMGDEMSLSDTLDERARPVDKEVFLRKLNFYQIRSGET